MKKEFTKVKLSPKVLRKISRLAEENKTSPELILKKVTDFLNDLHVQFGSKLTWKTLESNLELISLSKKIPQRRSDIIKLQESIEEERRLAKEYEEDYMKLKNLDKQLDELLNKVR
ncbi:MAG: hypothetical protein ACTSQE_13870 [Candidatus Heimdallarchaeaceae archaeon]